MFDSIASCLNCCRCTDSCNQAELVVSPGRILIEERSPVHQDCVERRTDFETMESSDDVGAVTLPEPIARLKSKADARALTRESTAFRSLECWIGGGEYLNELLASLGQCPLLTHVRIQQIGPVASGVSFESFFAKNSGSIVSVELSCRKLVTGDGFDDVARNLINAVGRLPKLTSLKIRSCQCLDFEFPEKFWQSLHRFSQLRCLELDCALPLLTVGSPIVVPSLQTIRVRESCEDEASTHQPLDLSGLSGVKQIFVHAHRPVILGSRNKHLRVLEIVGVDSLLGNIAKVQHLRCKNESRPWNQLPIFPVISSCSRLTRLDVLCNDLDSFLSNVLPAGLRELVVREDSAHRSDCRPLDLTQLCRLEQLHVAAHRPLLLSSSYSRLSRLELFNVEFVKGDTSAVFTLNLTNMSAAAVRRIISTCRRSMRELGISMDQHADFGSIDATQLRILFLRNVRVKQICTLSKEPLDALYLENVSFAQPKSRGLHAKYICLSDIASASVEAIASSFAPETIFGLCFGGARLSTADALRILNIVHDARASIRMFGTSCTLRKVITDLPLLPKLSSFAVWESADVRMMLKCNPRRMQTICVLLANKRHQAQAQLRLVGEDCATSVNQFWYSSLEVESNLPSDYCWTVLTGKDGR